MPAPLPQNARSLTRNGMALVTEADGSISGRGATGIFWRDRRIVSGLTLTVDGTAPVLLSGARVGPSTDHLTYGLWGDEPDPLAVLVRQRSLDGGYGERLELTCFRQPARFTVGIAVTPGRALVYHLDDEPPPSTGERIDPALAAATELSSTTMVVTGRSATAEVSMLPGQHVVLDWRLGRPDRRPPPPPGPALETNDARLATAFERAGWDLEALTVTEPGTGLPFVAAGAPHFLAVFGRDALTVALLTMALGTGRALDILDVLAAHQGTGHDPVTLEEPGRIVHELRVGEMGVFGLDAGTPYYGSVDATPLFVVVLAECLRWGAPAERLRALLPAARAAVGWCRAHVDPLGFVWSIPHQGGLDNQGWKDSGDSIVRPDGSVVRGPTSLVEVQGHVHEALLGLAELETAVGRPEAAEGLRREAAAFRQRFQSHYVVDPPVHLALALDEAGRPIPVRASNVGHLLAGELVDAELAGRLADRLLSPEEFSGWGVRTLASSERAYNPLGYHVGSVWPHDTALLLRGLSQRGLRRHGAVLAEALLDLSAHLDHQLPELLGGFDRDRFATPVPYPASARPQAWAAAVPVAVVTALLGLHPAAQRNELQVRPILPPGITVRLGNLRLGDRRLTIEATGDRATVTGDVDGLDIIPGDGTEIRDR